MAVEKMTSTLVTMLGIVAEKTVARTRTPRWEPVYEDGRHKVGNGQLVYRQEDPYIDLVRYRTVHKGAPALPHQSEREKARRRRQLRAGRMQREAVYKGDLLQALQDAEAEEHPRTLVVGGEENGFIAKAKNALFGRRAA